MKRPSLLSSTRARVLVGALVLLAATTALTVVVSRIVLTYRLNERIDRELAQEVDEFRRVAEGLDPATGQPFGEDLDAIFEAFFDRNVPGDDEVILVLRQGRPYLRSAGAVHPVEELAPLVAQWAAVETPRYATAPTPEGPLRSLAIPVENAAGEVVGTFVVGQFVARAAAGVNEAMRVAAIVGATTFVLAAALTWVIAGRVLAPLRSLAVTAAAIGENNLSQRIPERGGGELRALTTTFNAMLDRVDDALATQRAFLDDAGHELRTPITVIRGHLELIEPGQPLDAATRAIVLDELDRMHRLVEDLLTMAQAERPDFVVLGPTDVADLTIEIADKAAPLADRSWSVRADAVVVAEIDRQRIVQAWMNLVRNAIAHTAEGDAIEIFSRVAPGPPGSPLQIELGVSDGGEGVDPADRERIFARFGRGRSGRRPRGDGAGLGLAIVAAIAEAHGGSVRLTDTPGGGATFVIGLNHPGLPDINDDGLDQSGLDQSGLATDRAEDPTEELWPAS